MLPAGLAALAVLGTVSFVVWVQAGASEEEAEALRGRLRALDGVASARGSYTTSEDIPFAGSSSFGVTMAPRSTADEVVEVVATAYEALNGPMRRDPADLSVEVDGVDIRLHTEGPDAREDDLLRVVRFALDAGEAGETVEADLNARDHDDLGDLASEIVIRLPEKSSEVDVLDRLATIRAEGNLPPDVDLHVMASDGSGLGGSRGLPTPEDVEVWRELSTVTLPGEGATVRVAYGPYQIYSGMRDYGFADVTVVTEGRAATKEQRTLLIAEHRRILAEHHHTFVYSLTVNGEGRAWFRAEGDPT